MTNNSPQTLSHVEYYLSEEIQRFVKDPADTDFQKGYEAALNEVYYEFFD